MNGSPHPPQGQSPKVSVCMAMYNASRFLRECIDSILAQTFKDFELLIVDDGSTDDSCHIAESYKDPRIRLVRNVHDYIASLNLLLGEAKGAYIARMDADDMMLPDRLAMQYAYMEEHPEVGVLGGGMQQFGAAQGVVMPLAKVTMHDMVNACCIAHPTIMLRTKTIRDLGLHYEEAYKYAEDYRLWMELFKHGVIFHNLTEVVLEYRVSSGQITSTHSLEQADKTQLIKLDGANWILERTKEISEEKTQIPLSGNKLTVVIPFLNEYDEVANTVRAVRATAGNEVDVIVINDHSDDDYDYEQALNGLDVHYIYNEFRIGAAASKEKGARLVNTPYFLLLDAHMRCFTPDWHRRIVKVLDADDRQLLCCQSKALGKDKDGTVYDKGGVLTDGAFVTFNYHDYIPGIHWNEEIRHDRLPGDKIPCVLGAGYAASKRYWKLIRGLEGLMHYGSEETYISLKAWMEGGGCTLLPEVIFGHIYRERPPYRIVTAQMHYNALFISCVLFPTSLKCWAYAAAYQQDPRLLAEIQFWLELNRHTIEALRSYYLRFKANDFNQVIAINEVVESGKRHMALHERKRIDALASFTAEAGENCHSPWLWDGYMGCLVSLCEYEACTQADCYDDLGCDLLERICALLTPRAELPVSLSHGVCGIGWGLIYLLRNGMADANFREELDCIDGLVMQRDVRRISDFTLETGLGGILCYVVNRLYLCKERHECHALDQNYLRELHAATSKALQKAGERIDIRTHSYALQFLAYDSDNWHILLPRLKDIIDLPFFLPQDPHHWKPGLDGAFGYLCNLALALRASERTFTHPTST